MTELNENQLFEKAYFLLLSNVDVTNIDIMDAATYPEMETCEECGDHQASESGETFEMDWDDDITIKIARLASNAAQDILSHRKGAQEHANQEHQN